jgi:hypothetical protein
VLVQVVEKQAVENVARIVNDQVNDARSFVGLVRFRFFVFQDSIEPVRRGLPATRDGRDAHSVQEHLGFAFGWPHRLKSRDVIGDVLRWLFKNGGLVFDALEFEQRYRNALLECFRQDGRLVAHRLDRCGTRRNVDPGDIDDRPSVDIDLRGTLLVADHLDWVVRGVGCTSGLQPFGVLVGDKSDAGSFFGFGTFFGLAQELVEERHRTSKRGWIPGHSVVNSLQIDDPDRFSTKVFEGMCIEFFLVLQGLFPRLHHGPVLCEEATPVGDDVQGEVGDVDEGFGVDVQDRLATAAIAHRFADQEMALSLGKLGDGQTAGVGIVPGPSYPAGRSHQPIRLDAVH